MRLRVLLAVGVFLCSASPAVSAPSFDFVRFDSVLSSVYPITADVSADGQIVVGSVSAPVGRRAFRWSASTGTEMLAVPAGPNVQSGANAISGDGRVVVGQVELAQSSPGAYWASTTDIHLLTSLSDATPTSLPWSVSSDGSTIVGRTGTHAFSWQVGSGFRDLGDLPGGIDDSTAYDVSADGRTIVGESGSAASRFGEAFVWTEATGMVGIGGSRAFAVSADGSTVVGQGMAGAGGFIWTAATGLQSLTPPGSTIGFGSAWDVSGDGSTVVGQGGTPDGPKALLWTRDGGAQRLDLLLTALGLDVSGWDLRLATGISEDGSTIVGFGRPEIGHETVFIAVIPEPGVAVLLGAGLALLASGRRTDPS